MNGLHSALLCGRVRGQRYHDGLMRTGAGRLVLLWEVGKDCLVSAAA